MTTALLLMDLQVGVINRLGADGDYLDRAVQAQEHAEQTGIPVFLVHHDFSAPRPVGPPPGSAPRMTLEGPDAELHPRLLRGRGEVVVTKARTSAFAGGALQTALAAVGATHLVLAGLATSGVVLSTVREAADRDYELTVLTDLCLDFDAEVHRVLTQKVFPRQATGLSVADWTSASKGNS